MVSDKPSQMSELLIDRIIDEGNEWIESGACTDAEVDPFDPTQVEAMKVLCGSCPVFQECDDYRVDKNFTSGYMAGVDMNEEAGV